MKTTKHEIIVHGIDHSDYFQGCGAGHFDHVFTGAGIDAAEAYVDAAQQAYMTLSGIKLPTKPRGVNKRLKVSAKDLEDEMNSIYVYVSIRVKGV